MDAPPVDYTAEEQDSWLGCGGCLLIIIVLPMLIVLGSAALLIILMWPLAFTYSWQWLRRIVESPFGRLGVTGSLLAVALGLFAVREEARRLYGVVEVVLGGAVIWFGLLPTSTNVAATLAVAGGIYIVVRGLDNYARGDEAAERERDEERRRGVETHLEASSNGGEPEERDSVTQSGENTAAKPNAAFITSRNRLAFTIAVIAAMMVVIYGIYALTLYLGD